MELLEACLNDAASLGYAQLSVSGGEPLLYGPLEALLRRARQLGMLTTMTSNGMLADEKRWAPIAPHVDVLAVSIDGTETEHDSLRQRAGCFARILRNLEFVRATQVPFGFIFTLTQHNADSLEFVVRLAKEQGARSVQVHPLTLHGRAIERLPSARPDGVELIAALVEGLRLGVELDIAVQIDALTAAQLRGYRSYLVPERPLRDLTRAAPVLVVDPNAQVLPLTHEVAPSLSLGSLYERSLSRLAQTWLTDGRADALASSCELTWLELAHAEAPAFYWYDEVAARTRKIREFTG